MKHNLRMILVSTLIFVTLMLIISASGILMQAARAQATGSGLQQGGGTSIQQAGDLNRTIAVVGTGAVNIEPDFALIRVGVVTTAETASEAITENSTQMEALLQALEDAGLGEDDIQTQSLLLFPTYANQPQGQVTTPEISGYEARNIVQVRVEDLDEVGNIIDTAVQAGGNAIESIDFQINQTGDAFEQARKAALEDARQKAEPLASLAGVELGPVHSIEELGQTGIPLGSGSGGADIARQAAPVEPGSLRAAVTVLVRWSLVGGGAVPAASATATSPGSN